MKIKVTAAQQEVLLLMADGWELGKLRGWGSSPGRVWLQKDGIGRGGESKTVNGNVRLGLLKKGLIEASDVRDARVTHYRLTGNGKSVVDAIRWTGIVKRRRA